MSTPAAVLPLFRALAPEFGPKGPTRKTNDEVLAIISIVIGVPDSGVFGARFAEAVAELAAHKFELQERRARSLPGFASTGPVASVGVKGAAFSHTAASSPSNSHEDDALRQTTHGEEYLSIRDSRACASFGVAC